MAQNVAQTINTKATSSNQSGKAPSVALVVSSTTQVPIHAETVQTFTQGEQPQVLTHMKDGTWVYIAQNLLTQTGGLVSI